MLGRNRSAFLASILLLAMFALLVVTTGHTGGVGVSIPGHEAAEPPAPDPHDLVPFKAYKVPELVSRRANRDIEFHWSNNYRLLFNRPLDSLYTGNTHRELDQLGQTICETLFLNPFGFPFTDIQMMYDYFNRRSTNEGSFRDSLYNDNEAALVGYRIFKPAWPDTDRKHTDTYVYVPYFPAHQGYAQYNGDAGENGRGTTYSMFTSPEEDTSTGHPVVDANSEWHHNSLMIPGPWPSGIGQTDPANRWTKSDTTASYAFNHEFVHLINREPPAQLAGAMSELMSSAAEAVGGELPQAPQNEVPYSWGLLRDGGNYQAWRSFGAYLAFQFRGADTSSSGRADDLLWRWAGRPTGDVSWFRLADRLSPAECAECTLRTYFHGLSPEDRRDLVVHNWRVAGFANAHDLAEHQFGFIPHLGFDPIRDLRAWEGFNIYPSDDSVSVPHEFTMDSQHLTREVSFAGPASALAGVGTPRSTTLEVLGGDYWSIRAGASLGGVGRDLVVRVRPDIPCYQVNRRIMATVIQYRESALPGGQSEPLWKHPEWIRGVLGPVWTDLAVGQGGPIELVVPNFGDSTKAIAVVLTLGDPTGGGGSNGKGKVRYRLNLGFRSGSYLSPNPVLVYSEPTAEDVPGFSPAGDTLVFAVFDPEVSQRRIYRASVAGGVPTLLVQPPGSANEDRPDWSPRGDWVAFDREVTPTQSAIWAYSVRGQGLRQLTSSGLHEYSPAFNPNGQRIAYLRSTTGGGREVRVVSIAGAGDSLLVSRGTDKVVGPRWAPDGRYVYFVASDTLYSVAIANRAVVMHRHLGPSIASFALPLGDERIAVERTFSEPLCGTLVSATLRRTMLHDTLSGRDEMAFARPRTRTSAPAWSVDGTRLAFITNPTPFDSCDVRVGQVRYNHAPSWAFPGQIHDYEVGEGVPFSLNLNSTDFDGESLTFAGACLPPGATVTTVNPATGAGRLDWPSPGPLGSEHYLAVRGLDPSGGVVNKVIKLTVVQSGGGGGCPFVDVATGDGWVTDNSILGRSRTNELGLDAYRLKATPATRGNRVRLRLRENEQELTTLDQVKLVAVDRAPGLTLLSSGGDIHWGERVPAYRAMSTKGEDITSFVTGAPGTLGWHGSPGDTALIEMLAPSTNQFGLTGTQDGGGGSGGGDEKEVELRYDPSEGGGRYAAGPGASSGATPASVTDATWLDQTGIRVQVPDGAGGWQDLQHWYPRENNDEVYFPGLTHPQARLIFVGRHRLTFFGRLKPASGAVTQAVLSPLSATHTRLGDARAAVGASETVTELAPGDTLNLEFQVPPPVSGMVREYFLVTRGVYTSNVPASRLQPQAPATPSRYALLQNVPNPFAITTAIQFELPRAERVKLEVFDLTGRRVRTLADGEWPAGYHTLEWDRSGDSGQRLRAGVYLYRLTAGSYRDQKKMVIGAR